MMNIAAVAYCLLMLCLCVTSGVSQDVNILQNLVEIFKETAKAETQEKTAADLETFDDHGNMHKAASSQPRETGCPPHTHDCVPYYQCINGEINISGENLIDIRTRPLRECTAPENPHVPGMCCRLPDELITPKPLTHCPAQLVCVEDDLCNEDGTINTDGSDLIDRRVHRNIQTCLLDENSPKTGVCCELVQPPLDRCPGGEMCLPQQLCLDLEEGNDVCFMDKANYITGICCNRYTEPCPSESVCIPEYECKGDILDRSRSYLPANEGNGNWSLCSLNDTNEIGVCCRYYPVTPDPKYVAAKDCGIRNYGHKGRSHQSLSKNLAQFGEFPWQAIIFFSNFTFKCGASLIEDRWVITGAHCVSGYSYSDFKIRLGEWQVNSDEEPLLYLDVDIVAIYIHPKFNDRNLQNNIALIKLKVPVTYQYHINSICIPPYERALSQGTRCIATGWGKDAFGGSFQTILHKVDVPFVEHEYCQALLRKTRLGRFFRLHETFACFGGEENKDACTGDGGGPLACKDPSTGQYYLYGITSWGIGCGQRDVPGVYADVKFFIDWIIGIIYS